MFTDVVLVPLQSIIVHRGDNRVTPRIGTPFQFTAGEAEKLLRDSPNAVRQTEDPPEVDEQMTEAHVEPLHRPEPRQSVRPSGVPAGRTPRRPVAASRDDGEV